MMLCVAVDRDHNRKARHFLDSNYRAREDSLFFSTVYHPENSLSGDRVPWPEELSTSVGSGALSTSLENPREGVVLQIVETEC
jgi:hypothetical protein